MAVILGCSKGTDLELRAMYQTVHHRGQATTEQQQVGTVRLLASNKLQGPNFKHSSGSYQKDKTAIVVAGAVFDEHYNNLSPAQVLSRFLEQGKAFAQQLQGAYVIAIATQQQLYLIRDATGQRTIYYRKANQRLAFCIESKGLQQLADFSPKLNLPALFQYLSYSFVPMQGTMLQEIKELPAGYLLCYDLNKHQIQETPYFQLAAIPKHDHQSEDYWIDRVKKAVHQEIDQQLKGQEAVGIFLSGGLDSSIIAGQVAQRHQAPVHTFSIHFGKSYPNELDYARLVAERYQTQHHEVEIQPAKFLPQLRNTIWHLDDPIGDPITVPNCELAKYASNYVPVIFNGEGSDPCFGGPKNIPMLLGQWYGGIERPARFREKAYLASYRRGYAHLQQLLAPDLWKQLDETAHLENILTPFFDAPNLNFLDKLMSINIRLKGAHLILPKVERMLGTAGLPAIAPFFTKAIVEASMQMPSNLKLHQGIEKYILKRAFATEVPLPIIERPKSGMRVPVRYWFQGELKKYARHILQTKKIKQAGIFNPATVKALLKYDSSTGLKRHGLLTWMLLTFEIWRRIFIEKESL